MAENCDCDIVINLNGTNGSMSVDQAFDPHSMNAQSGTAVQDAIDELATKVELTLHTGNSDIHVTTEDKIKWNDTYRKSEVDTKITDLSDRVTDLEAVEVDQSYNPESQNAQSGTALKEALDTLPTVEDVEAKADQTEVDDLSDRITELESIKVDQTYNGESANAQSGTAVAEAIAPLAKNEDLLTHTSNSDIHVTIEEKQKIDDSYTKAETDAKLNEKLDKEDLKAHTDNTEIHITESEREAWNAKVDTHQIAEMVTEDVLNQFLQEQGDNIAHFQGTVDTEENLPRTDSKIGDIYGTTDTGATYIWTGAEWRKLSEDLSGFAIKSDVEESFADVDDRLTQLEGISVDQHFYEDSSNAASGKAVKEAFDLQRIISGPTGVSYMSNEENGGIIKFTTSDGKVGKITAYDGTDINNTLVQIIAYNEDESMMAKLNFSTSGVYYTKEKASEFITPDLEIANKRDLSELSLQIDNTINAYFEQREVITTIPEEEMEAEQPRENIAYMKNEENGGLIKFTKYTGEVGKITTFDGSDSEGTYIQLVTHNADKSKMARINFTLDGAFYSKDASGTTVSDPENEIVTKKDLQIAGGSIVDKTYDPSSNNPQSGKAVAEAIKDLAKKTETVTIETNDSDPTNFTSIKFYDADGSAPNLEDREDGVLYLDAGLDSGGSSDVVVDQSYSAESTNPQSGTAVAEAVKDLATKTELSEKANASDLVQITTFGGNTVTFKSIMFFPNAADAPPLEEREDGVLYLIGEQA